MIQVDHIISAVRVILQDPTAVRWTDAELAMWLNAGVRDVVALRPDIAADYRDVPLVAGFSQKLPNDCTRLLDVVINTGGATKTTVVPITRRVLDVQFPNWANEPASAVTKHIIYDERSPTSFFVYPPAVAGNKLMMLCSITPAPVEAQGAVTAPGQTINMPVRMMNSLIEYVLYRAFSKDAEDENYVSRAAAHLALFKGALADDAAVAVAASVQEGGRPTVAPRQ